MRERLLAALAAFGLAAGAAPASAAPYVFTQIDAPGPNVLGTTVDSINNKGVATGYYVVGGMAMGVPTQSYVGFTVNADGTGFTSFTRAGYAQTGASGINDAGDIVGVSVLTYGVGTGFLRDAMGTFTDIDPNLGGITSAYSEANGINDAGKIVGFFTPTLPPSIEAIPYYSHGFIDDGGTYTQFDVPAALGYATQLFTINDAGVITGSFIDALNQPRGFIYDPLSGFTVPGPPLPSSVGAVNAGGDFPYAAQFPNPASPVGYVSAAVVFRGGVPVPLSPPGALSTEGQGINDAGQVTGYFIDFAGIHGFIANPVPEPLTWAMMVIGFALVGAAMRRRERAAAVAALA